KAKNPVTGNHDFRSHRETAMWALGDGVTEELFICPSAVGASSVIYKDTRVNMEARGMVHVLDYDLDGHEEYTEYWFNDYRENLPTSPGISGQLLRVVPHPAEVTLSIDAVDWIPRHRKPSEKVRFSNDVDSVGSSNLLRGDLRVQMMTEAEYVLERDKYGSGTAFFRWGHEYTEN
ncbi:MAG: hypothetical protein K8E66_04965, partial [Phycisphaerales bacterium]|nr:hypothetical protein [Phycisphaerales bacterium]